MKQNFLIITGGTGFLGKRLSRKLREHNHDIMSYDIIDGYDILNTSQLKQVFDNFKPDKISPFILSFFLSSLRLS